MQIMSDDRNNHRNQNNTQQQQQQHPPPWNSPPSSSAVFPASALLGCMNAAAATTAAAVLQSAEVQSIFEDVYGGRTTVTVGDVSRRGSSSNSTAGAAATAIEAAQIQDIAWMRQKQQEFNMAVRLLPDTDKAAYQEALTRSPHLVAVESPPKRYLQIERDPMDAARRLCAYWRQRKACFGTRAFLPMVQTGTGALSPEDVEMLGSGFGMLLPPDRYGRTVLLHDRVRLNSLNADQRLRCIFYLLQVASEMSGAHLQPASKGLVWMTVYSDKTRASAFDAHTSTRALKLCASGAFPLQFKAFHLIMMTNRPILDRVVPTTLELLQEHFPHLRQRTMVHPKLALPVMLKSLEVNHGFDAENLPKVPLGGRWTIGSFKRWRDDRLHREQKWLEKIKNKKEAQAAMLTHSAIPFQFQQRAQQQEPQLPVHQQQRNDERIQRKERILPQVQTQQNFQEESLAMASNYYYDEDSDMDEKIASSALTEQEDEDRRKRRAADAMYARRRRVRRQIEIEGMQEQVHRLRRQKMGLQKTKEMLLGLLHQAQECVQREVENKEFVSGADISHEEFSDIDTRHAKMDASRVTRSENDLSAGQQVETSRAFTGAALASTATVPARSSADHGHFEAPSGAEISVGVISAADSSKTSDNGSFYSEGGKGQTGPMLPTNVAVGFSLSGKAAVRQSGAENLKDACSKPSGRCDEYEAAQNTQRRRHDLSTAFAAELKQQSQEERQQSLVQSWHEQYARYQTQVFKYIQERREEQQAEAAAALATAVLQGAVEQQASPRQTTSMLGSDLNNYLLLQARVAWMQQQQQQQDQGQRQESVSHDDGNSNVPPSQRHIELPD